MSTSIGNNFISAMGTIASSNLQVSQFQKSAEIVKSSGSDKEKQAALRQFEGLFIGQLMKLMFNQVPVDENFGGGFAEETYRDMLTDQYGDSMSKMGGIGIANELQKTLFDFQNVDKDTSKVMAGANAYSKVYNNF